MANLTLILGFLTAAPVLLYLERKLTFLMTFIPVTALLWYGAPEMGLDSPQLRFLWIFLGVAAGAFVAIGGKR